MRMPIIMAVPRRGIVRGLLVGMPIIVAVAVFLIMAFSGMVVAVAFGVGGHFTIVANGGAVLVGVLVGGIGCATGEKECGGE